MEGLSNFGIATGAFIAERDDWDESVAKAAAIGYQHLELTAITLERLDRRWPFWLAVVANAGELDTQR